MSLARLEVMYGKLEGAEGKFARDPTGHLGIDAGVYSKKGLEVSWQHVQGTEERYRRLESGAADISFVVGRAALEHFLHSKVTRLIGSSMNSCPYYLVVKPGIREIGDLKGKSLACRESTARISPLALVFEGRGLILGEDVTLSLPSGDQDTFDLLISGEVEAALLPRPYSFIAEEKGLERMVEWPDVVDDPLPVTIETTEKIFRERKKDLAAFLKAHREAIRYLKKHRAETVDMLSVKFGHAPSLAAKTYDEYLVWLGDQLTIDFGQLEKLLAQVAPDRPGGARNWPLNGSFQARCEVSCQFCQDFL